MPGHASSDAINQIVFLYSGIRGYMADQHIRNCASDGERTLKEPETPAERIYLFTATHVNDFQLPNVLNLG